MPHLVDVEVTHALRGHVRSGRVGPDDGQAALTRWARLGVRRFAVTGLLSRIWELQDNLSAHEATYVALAEACGCQLVTADARLARAPGPSCPVTVVRR